MFSCSDTDIDPMQEKTLCKKVAKEGGREGIERMQI